MRGRASMLSSGALVIHSGRRVKARPVGSPLAGQPNERTETSVWVSTLLGPEEAAASQGFLERPAGVDLRMKVHAAWFRPYLENYTVDASIFCWIFF